VAPPASNLPWTFRTGGSSQEPFVCLEVRPEEARWRRPVKLLGTTFASFLETSSAASNELRHVDFSALNERYLVFGAVQVDSLLLPTLTPSTELTPANFPAKPKLAFCSPHASCETSARYPHFLLKRSRIACSIFRCISPEAIQETCFAGQQYVTEPLQNSLTYC
jgi:hypothetical protein